MIFSTLNKNVILTGATGFIGQHLVPLLLKNDFNVVAISRNKSKARKFDWYRDVKFIEMDIKDGIGKLTINENITLIHLAWSGLPNYRSNIHLNKNLPQSFNFIKSLVKDGLKRVVVAGTCLEYGNKNGPIKSSSRCRPDVAYGVAKDCLHKKLSLLKQKKPFILQWLRLFYTYGKGQNSKSILSQLDQAIDKKYDVFNMSGGEQLRDYLPVEDVAKQIIKLFQGRKDGIYNVCSGEPISILQLVENHVKKRKAKIKLNLGHYPYLDYEPMKFWGVKDIY